MFVAALVLILFPLQSASTLPDFPVIATSFGPIRGFSYTADDGTEAQIFKRIPFASSPIGALRWRKPQPPKPCNLTLDGTFFGPACAQKTSKAGYRVAGYSEDCLYLNIFTSQRCRESNASCAVAFVVHGGMSIKGSTHIFADETLVRNYVSQDIVVVTTAYRLSAFGVLALGDENELPANLALHDIIAAFHFTRAEIGRFGGDKERITLFGQSQGGGFVIHAAFSPGISKPGEKRPFTGVISMSGNGGLEPPETTVNRTHSVARELGCEGSAREIMKCLKLFDTESILEAAFKVHGLNESTGKGPRSVTRAGELFPINNERELRERKDPIRLMIGTTINELKSEKPLGLDDKVNRVLGVVNKDECFEKYLDDLTSGVFDSKYGEAAQEMIMTTHTYAKYIADIGGEAYLYEYDYPEHANHADDAFLVLGLDTRAFEKDENEQWLSRVYSRCFANFINGLQPAEDWSPVDSQLMNYFSVNRSRTDNVLPHMKNGYQKDLVEYFQGIINFDKNLTKVKRKILNAPIRYKMLNTKEISSNP